MKVNGNISIDDYIYMLNWYTTMEITNIKISDIKNYERNNKNHPKKQIDKIKKSIKEFGFKNPVLLDGDNYIIAGHGRVEAAKGLNFKEVPCIYVTDLSEDQIKAYRIADNKTAESDFNFDMLKLEFEDLNVNGFDVELTGFDMNEIDSIIGKEIEEDEFEGPEEVETDIKEGDVIILGDHRLMCGDSTNKDHVEILMNNLKADVVFSDPPYGMFLDTDYSSLNWNGRKGKKYNAVKGDHDDFDSKLITSIFDNFDYCKEIFLWGADYYYKYIKDFDEGNFIVWDKTLESNGDAGSNSEFELLWSKNKHKRQVIHFNWFRFFGLSEQDIKIRKHPTQKPLQVCTPFIKDYSKKNNIILDPFGGSGSTLIAAEQLDRRCFMMEIDPHYCEVICQRWEKLTGKKRSND